MDISTIVNPWLSWIADQLALLSNLPPAYIMLAALVPLLIALTLRDLLATLWTALFALGAISLCAAQEINWTLLATFEATFGLVLAATAVIWRRQRRAHRDELRAVRDELSGLQERLNALEACERLRNSRSLHRPLDTAAMLLRGEDAKKKFSIAPK
jgi:membrane protein implicated in regulation of membrane protease activity